MNFKDLFDYTPEEIKLKFLRELLERNSGIRQQFFDYIHSSGEEETGEQITPEEHIREETASFRNDLEMLDFEEPDWENYVPRHSGYIPEYEAMEHMAEDMVNEEFEWLKNGILEKFKSGKTDEALFQYIGAYNACISAEIEDELEAIGDHKTYFLETLKEIEEFMLIELSKAVLTKEKATTITKVLFEEYISNHPGEGGFLKFFEPLLLTLCCDEAIAAVVEQQITKYKIPGDKLPQLMMKIHSLKGETRSWLQEGEKLMLEDKAVAEDMLQHYLQTSNQDFLRTARKIFYKSTFRDDFLEFIYNHTDQNQAPNFYKDLLKALVDRTRNAEYYKKLRELMEPEEKELFIIEYKRNPDFYTLMLAIENRHEEILELLNREENLRHFTSIIQRILYVYPDESFRLLKNKCLKKVEHERGRPVYERIVEYLKLAARIPGKQNEVRQLADTLYNWKPRLPALREKLKKAGMR